MTTAAHPYPAPIDERLKWAKIASVVGGILLIAGGALMLLLVALATSFLAFANEPEASFVAAFVGAFFVIASLGGVLLGILVLVGAAKLDGPNARTWAITILVCGCIAFFTGAGFFFGAVAAIAGGALALVALPAPPA